MAVDFSLLPPNEVAQDAAPSRFVWTVAFFVMVLTGVFVVLFFWPKAMPTQTWKFWTCVVLFPVGIPAWIVLRRYSAYEGRKLDTALRDEAVQAFNERVFNAASIPLVIVGAAHRFSAERDENAAERIRQGTVVLKTQDPVARDGEPVKARWFVIPGIRTTPSGGGEGDRDRRRLVTAWLFGELLDDLLPRIQALPAHVALTIRLSVSNGFTHQENDSLWQACWHARSLRKAPVAPAAESPASLMMLDRWLDEMLGNEHVHATLVIAVQLHPLLAGTPPAGASETGAAVLLVPEALARQSRMPRMADLHRPVRGLVDQPADALSHAVKWAGVPAGQIEGAWQTGLDATQAGALREPSRRLGLTARTTDLDQSVGYGGAAAPWLAVACAASSLTGETAAQIVLVGDGKHVDCAVLKQGDGETTLDHFPATRRGDAVAARQSRATSSPLIS